MNIRPIGLVQTSSLSHKEEIQENMLLKIYINLLLLNIASGNPDAKRLYSNLLANYDR